MISAFNDLSGDRPVGFSVGRIPFTAIDRYADRYGIEDFEEFHALIKAMDKAHADFRKTEGEQ